MHICGPWQSGQCNNILSYGIVSWEVDEAFKLLLQNNSKTAATIATIHLYFSEEVLCFERADGHNLWLSLKPWRTSIIGAGPQQIYSVLAH